MYYLRSRYYNPVWGRFLNADGLLGKGGKLLSHNLFAYCENNAVNSIDPNGHSPKQAMANIRSTTAGLLICVYFGLGVIKCDNSQRALLHSFSTAPALAAFGEDDPIVESIVASEAFKNVFRQIVQEEKFGQAVELTFPKSDLDLFGTLHDVNMTVDKEFSDQLGEVFSIHIQDTYDFKLENPFVVKKTWKDTLFYIGAMTVNNVAYVGQILGLVNEYTITVDFTLPGNYLTNAQGG